MEQDIMRDRYIGEIYVKDVYDFAQMELHYFSEDIPFGDRENKFVTKLRKSVQEEVTLHIFHVPAAFFQSLWLVYHGMLTRALILDAIWIVLFELIFSDVVRAVAGIIYILVYGFRGMFWYYKYLHGKIAKRGLLMRSPVDSEELTKSLSKEGKPSLKRAVIYMLLRALVITCCNDIMFSLIM